MSSALASPASAAAKKSSSKQRRSSSSKRAAESEAAVDEQPTNDSHKPAKSAKKHKKEHRNEGSSKQQRPAAADDTLTTSATAPTPPGLYHDRLRLSMHLHPSRFSSVADGIAEQLNSSLLQYSDPLQGVMLTYSTPSIRQRSGSILFDRPHVNFAVEVEALVFRPSVGQLLDCVIHQVNNDHLSCLLYGCFNVTIDYYQIPPAYTYEYHSNEWRLSSNGEVRLIAGSTLRLLVTAIDTSYDICTLVGSLRHLEAGPLQPPANDCYTLSQEELEQESPPLQTQLHQQYQQYTVPPVESYTPTANSYQQEQYSNHYAQPQQKPEPAAPTPAAAIVGKGPEAKKAKQAAKLAEKEARRQAYIQKQRDAGHEVDEADVKIRLREKLDAEQEKASAKKEKKSRKQKKQDSD